MSDALCATCLHEKAEHGPLGDCFKHRPEGIHGPMCCQCVGYRTFDGFAANLRAQLAAAQERVRELEAEKADTDRLFDLQWKSDMRAIAMWQKATGRKLAWPDRADLIVWLMTEITQRDAEIAQLIMDQQLLIPGAVKLIKAFGTFSIERLPDWNFAVAIDGDIYGIGMTVFDAISSAAGQIDKIKETRKEAGE